MHKNLTDLVEIFPDFIACKSGVSEKKDAVKSKKKISRHSHTHAKVENNCIDILS